MNIILSETKIALIMKNDMYIFAHCCGHFEFMKMVVAFFENKMGECTKQLFF